MSRKRVTQIMPFLIPIRTYQRNLFYQIKMFFDKNKYSKKTGPLLPYEISQSKTKMLNLDSGHDIIYQENKIHNLKIVSQTMNNIIIYPGETFSFCYLSKHSKKYGRYKAGLVLVDNQIVPRIGGGICHLSNLLYYTFLMTPLTIVERHGHKIKSFPNPDKHSLEGVDATINSGWLDLKVRNDTDHPYQIIIDFDDEFMQAKILSDYLPKMTCTIINENQKYFKQNNQIYESTSVVKLTKDKTTGKILNRLVLYDEIVKVGYQLPTGTKIEEM